MAAAAAGYNLASPGGGGEEEGEEAWPEGAGSAAAAPRPAFDSAHPSVRRQPRPPRPPAPPAWLSRGRAGAQCCRPREGLEMVTLREGEGAGAGAAAC